jgi:enoyl-CoA hydratase/carnithine racemase
LTGDYLTAQRLYEVGFINKIVPPEQLMSEATAMAERLCEVAPLAARFSKQMYHKSRWNVDRTMREMAENLAAQGRKSEDTMEGNECLLREEKTSLERKIRLSKASKGGYYYDSRRETRNCCHIKLG